MTNYERVDAYFNNLLTIEESIEFEKDLQQDKELISEYEAYTAAQNVLKILAYDHLKEKLQKSEGPELKSRIFKMNFGKFIGVAASISLLVGFTFLLMHIQKYSSEAIFNAHQEIPVASGIRSDDDNNARYTQALGAYQASNYQLTIDILQQGNLDIPIILSREELYLLAYAYLQLDDYESTTSILSKINESGKLADEYNTEWIQLLINIKSGQHEISQKLAKEISTNPENPYQDDAEEILKMLNSVWYKLKN